MSKDTLKQERAITELHPHPLALALTPRHKEYELDALVTSIGTRGYSVSDPIIVTSDGYIIDGIGRYQAARAVGVEPLVQLYDDELGSIPAFILARSIRRDVSQSQKGMIVAGLVLLARGTVLPMFAELSDTDIAGLVCMIEQMAKSGSTGEVAAALASHYGVSVSYVYDALKLLALDGDGAVAGSVADGGQSLTSALAAIKDNADGTEQVGFKIPRNARYELDSVIADFQAAYGIDKGAAVVMMARAARWARDNGYRD